MNLSAQDDRPSLTWASWVYGLVLPLVYLLVELSFCNQLMHSLGDPSEPDILSRLEFWGRLISGVGLGLLLYRLVSARLPWRTLGLVLSLALGILVMWNLQKALIEHMVQAASPQDRQAAQVLVAVASQAGEGHLRTLAGDPLLASVPQAIEKNILIAIFPAAALHVQPREPQFAQWLQAAGTISASPGVPPDDLEDPASKAYRALIVAPLVIGLSLLFALLNLSLALSFVLCVARPRWRPVAAGLMWASLTIASLAASHPLLDARGYERSLRPALWEQSPALAVMVEWSGRAGMQWAPTSEWVHRHVLRGYGFGAIRFPHSLQSASL